MDSTSIIVREARIEDAIPLQKYQATLISENLPFLFHRDKSPTVEEEKEFIQSMSKNDGNVLLVAESDQCIVGMLDFFRETEPQRSHCGSFGVSSAKEHRRCGIGKQLLDALISHAEKYQIKRLELEVFSNNEAALALYVNNSFVREGEKVDAVELNGSYINIIQMARTL